MTDLLAQPLSLWIICIFHQADLQLCNSMWLSELASYTNLCVDAVVVSLCMDVIIVFEG